MKLAISKLKNISDLSQHTFDKLQINDILLSYNNLFDINSRNLFVFDKKNISITLYTNTTIITKNTIIFEALYENNKYYIIDVLVYNGKDIRKYNYSIRINFIYNIKKELNSNNFNSFMPDFKLISYKSQAEELNKLSKYGISIKNLKKSYFDKNLTLYFK